MGESNLAQDFIAGIDPLGIYTSDYGQRAEQAGVSQGRHAVKQLVGTAGGVLGGAVVVPTITSGVVGGIQQAAKGGGSLGSRAARFASGFIEGSKVPWKTLSSARTANEAVRKAIQGGDIRLTEQELAAVKNLMGQVPIGEVVKGVQSSGPSRGKRSFFAQASGLLDDAKSAKALLKDGVLTQRLAQKIEKPLATGYKTGLGALALGATIGGGGAAVQYTKGRKTEKDFQKRLARSHMQKFSAAESTALWTGYDLEVQKIASMSKLKEMIENLAYAAGARARKARDTSDAVRQVPSGLREKYMEGYHSRPKSKKKKEKIDFTDMSRARMYMIPAVAGAGTAGGALLGKVLRGSDEGAFDQEDSESYEENY